MSISSLRGFSLVDLSIVLVILGLLVGSVLSGAAMIKAATIRKQLNQISTIQTAINTFKDKYFFYPGDLPNATSFFGTTDVAGVTLANGNGDGIIMSTVMMSGGPYIDCLDNWPDERHSGGTGYEGVYFFQEILKAGLFNYSPGIGLEEWPHLALNDAKHIMVTCSMVTGPTPMSLIPPGRRFTSPVMYMPWDAGGTTSTYDATSTTGGMDNDDARIIDAKIDDSNPSTGNAWAIGGCAQGLSAYTAAACNLSTMAIKMN